MLFQCGDRLQTSDLDFHRHQFPTSKVGPRAEIVKVMDDIHLLIFSISLKNTKKILYVLHL